MPLCAQCHQNEATVHFNTVVDDNVEEAVHLCADCARMTGLHSLDPKQLEALTVIGKKCEFCGQGAFSGVMDTGGPVYWCFDCGLEFGRIFSDLCQSERQDLMQQEKRESSFLSFCCDPELQAWSEAANQKALQTLRERKQQDGQGG